VKVPSDIGLMPPWTDLEMIWPNRRREDREWPYYSPRFLEGPDPRDAYFDSPIPHYPEENIVAGEQNRGNVRSWLHA
jgi:hypothetical protein